MKRFVISLLGAFFFLAGLYAWVETENEVLASFMFALTFVCVIFLATIGKKNDVMDKWTGLNDGQKLSVIMMTPMGLSTIAFAIWLDISLVFAIWLLISFSFSNIDWKYILSVVGAVITITTFCGVAYSLKNLWDYMFDAENDQSLLENLQMKLKNSLSFVFFACWAKFGKDKD